jgi:hypothetical protein
MIAAVADRRVEVSRVGYSGRAKKRCPRPGQGCACSVARSRDGDRRRDPVAGQRRDGGRCPVAYVE